MLHPKAYKTKARKAMGGKGVLFPVICNLWVLSRTLELKLSSACPLLWLPSGVRLPLPWVI